MHRYKKISWREWEDLYEDHRKWVESKEVLGKRLELSEVDLSECDLSNKDLTGFELLRIHYSGKPIENVKWHGFRLKESLFTGTQFHKVDIFNGYMTGTYLKDVQFMDSALVMIWAENAQWDHVHCKNTLLSSLTLRNTRWINFKAEGCTIEHLEYDPES